ncbi:MAG: phage holin family protein [Chitinophagales bacterium]|nr:phage holin family protein [Chitinophagales bacterium]
MRILVKILISGFAVILTAYLLSGVSVLNYGHAILTALIIALLNVTIKPLLVIFTLPLTVLTLGLFLLVINSCVIMIADYLLAGFSVENFWWALLFSLILSLINSILYSLVDEQ